MAIDVGGGGCVPKSIKILIKTDDGVEFNVPQLVATVSPKLQSSIEEAVQKSAQRGDEHVLVSVVLTDVTSAALRVALDFCRDQYLVKCELTEASSNNKTWDEFVANMDSQMLCEFAAVAYVLDVRPMVDLSCRAVAGLLTGRSAAEVSATFSFQDSTFTESVSTTANDVSTHNIQEMVVACTELEEEEEEECEDEIDELGELGGAKKKKRRKRKKKKRDACGVLDNNSLSAEFSISEPKPGSVVAAAAVEVGGASVGVETGVLGAPGEGVVEEEEEEVDEVERFRRKLEAAHLNPLAKERIRIQVPSSFKFSRKPPMVPSQSASPPHPPVHVVARPSPTRSSS